MPQLFTNNASTTLSGAHGTGATVLAVADGSKFPSPGTGDYFTVTIESGSTREIVKCTARAGNNLTVDRAQEGTTAQAWAGGETVELRITALKASRQPFAPYQFEWIEGTSTFRQGYVSLGDWPGDSINTKSLGTGTLHYEHFQLGTEVTLSEVAIDVSTGAAGATVRVGLAKVDRTGQPTKLVAEFGVLDASTTGIKAVTGLSALLPPGRYAWLVQSNATACSLRAIRSGSPWFGRLLGSTPQVFNNSLTRADAAFADPPEAFKTQNNSAAYERFVFVRLSYSD